MRVVLRPSRLKNIEDYLIPLFLLSFLFIFDSMFGVPFIVWIPVLIFSFSLVLFREICIRTTRYIITDRRIISETGLLSRKKQITFVESVSNVSYEQSSSDSLLGIGDVVIDSRAGKEARIVFRGVRNPAKIVKKIEKLVK
ncbi:MAG: PH domain-containing protein, partial [Candidatus Micrarchaeota archaeon]|nr:PH domain-containing protein [Candidatus Micrarchaeota archaeon]